MNRALPILMLSALMTVGGFQPATIAAPASGARPPEGDEVPTRLLLDGVELHYVERGSGIPVVLVHGSLADYTYWSSKNSNQLKLLGEKYRVIAYSRRYNFPNRNEPQTNHSPIVEAADLLKLLDRLGLDRVHLVGHSYGAYTALVFALDHPDRLRTLTLAEPPLIPWLPDIPGGEGRKERFMGNVWEPLAKAFREGGDAAGLEFTTQWYFHLPFVQVAPEWQELLTHNVLEWRQLAISTQTYPLVEYERVRKLAVPTLLLSGGKNAGKMGDVIDAHLARLLPQVERQILPEATHEMFVDLPELSAHTMLEFFGRH